MVRLVPSSHWRRQALPNNGEAAVARSGEAMPLPVMARSSLIVPGQGASRVDLASGRWGRCRQIWQGSALPSHGEVEPCRPWAQSLTGHRRGRPSPWIWRDLALPSHGMGQPRQCRWARPLPWLGEAKPCQIWRGLAQRWLDWSCHWPARVALLVPTGPHL